jgi:hypothetical protein
VFPLSGRCLHAGNLTVLRQSPFEVAPEKLKDISVWGTMLEGRLQPIDTSNRSKNVSLKINESPAIAGSNNKFLQSKLSQNQELTAIRRLNAQYWESVGRDREIAVHSIGIRDSKNAFCGTVCSCSLNGILSNLIATGLNSENH